MIEPPLLIVPCKLVVASSGWMYRVPEASVKPLSVVTLRFSIWLEASVESVPPLMVVAAVEATPTSTIDVPVVEIVPGKFASVLSKVPPPRASVPPDVASSNPLPTEPVPALATVAVGLMLSVLPEMFPLIVPWLMRFSPPIVPAPLIELFDVSDSVPSRPEIMVPDVMVTTPPPLRVAMGDATPVPSMIRLGATDPPVTLSLIVPPLAIVPAPAYVGIVKAPLLRISSVSPPLIDKSSTAPLPLSETSETATFPLSMKAL